MKKSLIILLTFLLISDFLFAQIVETVAGPNPRLNNGLVVKSNGDVFASDFFGSGFNGSRIYKIAPDGSSELFASGLSQPAGLVFDDTGLLYVAEFTSGTISKIDEMGNVTRWVSGLSQPADLVFDSNGNLYVTNYGNGTISKINAEGMITTLTAGLGQPVGLTIDDKEQLYAASLSDGNIYKIDLDGDKSVLATINDAPIGFLTFSSDQLYVASTGGHKIYRVSLEGTVSEFAGTGLPGTLDGTASTAQFTNPDGIAVSPSGDSLYISENNTHLLRRILLDRTTGLQEVKLQKNELERVLIFPNPAQGYATAKFKLNVNALVELALFSSTGQHIQTIISTYLTKGEYTYTIPLGKIPLGAYYFQLKSGQFFESFTITIL